MIGFDNGLILGGIMAEKSDEILETLERTNELLELIAKISLGKIIEKEVYDEKLKKLYELTGKESITSISKKIGISSGKISAIWKKWEAIGMIVKDGKSYRRII